MGFIAGSFFLIDDLMNVSDPDLGLFLEYSTLSETKYPLCTIPL
tara:strand:- start:165 stop:296 length:132 start_codon:yes stop_codon:yes gene_type:complete